jgi:hypothetical protein
MRKNTTFAEMTRCVFAIAYAPVLAFGRKLPYHFHLVSLASH